MGSRDDELRQRQPDRRLGLARIFGFFRPIQEEFISGLAHGDGGDFKFMANVPRLAVLNARSPNQRDYSARDRCGKYRARFDSGRQYEPDRVTPAVQ